jgi:hypothetical protein
MKINMRGYIRITFFKLKYQNNWATEKDSVKKTLESGY